MKIQIVFDSGISLDTKYDKKVAYRIYKFRVICPLSDNVFRTEIFFLKSTVSKLFFIE